MYKLAQPRTGWASFHLMGESAEYALLSPKSRRSIYARLRREQADRSVEVPVRASGPLAKRHRP